MSTPRFYCPNVAFSGTPFTEALLSSHPFELPPAAAHHASRVLRLRINDAVHIFDGAGHELHGKISEINGKKVLLNELKNAPINPESPLNIILAQALCTGEKMDWIVQKATELGINEIQPLQTQYSTTKLTGDRAEKRTEHWRGITIAACEQCGRNTLPVVHPPLDLATWLADLQRGHPAASKLMLSPDSPHLLTQQPQPSGSVILLIGSEGGLSAKETALSERFGFTPVRLGHNILRAETAAIASMTALQTLWGEWAALPEAAPK